MTPSELSISNLPDTCTDDIRLPVHIKFRRGKFRGDEKRSIESAVNNLKAIASLTQRPDWSKLNILDYGCGVKFTQALIQYQVNVKNYVGMDVYDEMITSLREQVKQPNFHFYAEPFHNEMYNPNGVDLKVGAELPGHIKQFDLITLQSVFTHFNPPDFLTLLKVLRAHAADNARMLFTCFLDNKMSVDFLDSDPEKPLLRAYYKEGFVRDMLKESNWNPLQLKEPGSDMQHHFVCEPC